VLGSRYLGAVLPDSPEVRQIAGEAEYERGAELLEAQRFREAADRFQAAVEAIPESAEAHNNLGVALASLGDVAAAAEHFKTAVSLDPQFIEARNNLAAALASGGGRPKGRLQQ
jgi:Flp pilus assembly protein TadD